ncbi:unnamed protein product [Hermetia illucens]|uniref:C2H2-type domain-containing protein n=2 Tax=Hermetia illucens TaxID=343691 RepID=A0A7R8UGV7_HERIL|nr:unnamed protein product [Hermetia illucens]
MTHLNHDFQEEVSTEPRIKDEHGIEVCGNEDSEYDAGIVTGLEVGNEKKLCSNNGTNVANEAAEASISQLKLASLDEKISFCRDSNGHYEGEEDLILKSTCDIPIVFSLAPEYDEKKNCCITCNCEFESKQTFRSHKQIHRSKIRKWRIINRVEVKPERVTIVFSENPIFDNREYFCFTCNHKFPSRGSFKYHKYLHKVKIYEKQGIRLGASRMSCEFCTERYRSNTALKQHIVLRHGDAIPTYFKDDPTYLQCRFCHKQFERPTERYRHEEGHSKEEAPYRCSLCPKMFTMSWKREAHQSVHREDHQFRCLQCPKIYKSKVNLNRHIRKTHSGIKPFVCETLGESFDSKSILASNELQFQELGTSCEKIQTETNASVGVDIKFSTHKKTTPTSVELKGPTIIEKLPLCEESSSQKEAEKIQEGDFRYSSSFVFTLKPEYDNKRNFCISCDLQLDSKQSFKSHKSGHMYQVRRWKLANDLDVSQFRIVLSENPKYDEEKRFCITCNRGFTSIGSLKFHQRKHKKRILEKQGILPIICEFCSRKFESEESFRRHIVPHHGDKIPTHLKDDITYLKCRFCFKDFEKPTERYRHEQSHANEKTPYRCQFCPKSFIGNWRRKAHQSVHKTDCLFRCLQCPNSYKFKRSLNRHIRITHSGIKSDAGEASGDSFASKSPEAPQKLTVYEDDGVETSR